MLLIKTHKYFVLYTVCPFSKASVNFGSQLSAFPLVAVKDQAAPTGTLAAMFPGLVLEQDVMFPAMDTQTLQINGNQWFTGKVGKQQRC